MRDVFKRILVIQTAFIGDVILTLPMIQILKKNYPSASIDTVVVPRAAEICANHPAISQVILYDKRANDKGVKGFLKLLRILKEGNYDLLVVPHRSLRSAMLTWALQPERSIGFDRSAGRLLFSDVVRYDPLVHEIDRNVSLLKPLELENNKKELPRVYPSHEDEHTVNSIVKNYGLEQGNRFIAVAPGTIWNTKRWPADKYASICEKLSAECSAIFLFGGREDDSLCREIAGNAKIKNIYPVAGKLSLLQSAELIKRCRVLVSNDSAPMHLAVAVGTPVVAIFGATIPEFGFAPSGPQDIVVEIQGLQCRPCSIHGGKTCPIKTFDCMMAITPDMVCEEARKFL
jgi:heptosyltransferase II